MISLCFGDMDYSNSQTLLVDIFLTRRLSKLLAFCEFASVNFEPCRLVFTGVSKRSCTRNTLRLLSVYRSSWENLDSAFVQISIYRLFANLESGKIKLLFWKKT